MIVEPKFRGFICTTAHRKGCEKNVKGQIEYIESMGCYKGSKRALVIGSSTGYGLASRISLAFGAKASTLGVFFERPAKGKRTASPGYYNNMTFEAEASKQNIYAKSVNGDAFSDEIKNEVIKIIKEDLGEIDCIVYSLASPRRKDPKDGEVYQSVLKPIGNAYKNKTIDFHTKAVEEISIEPATEEEIAATVKVMGGEDITLWIDALSSAGVLSKEFKVVAYSYIGPELTHPIYKNGSIGRAKIDVERAIEGINNNYEGASAYVSVNKALVTQASSAIPVVPLYISILYKIMKEKGIHEGCIEQMDRLFRENMYGDKMLLDDENRIRIDDLEMRDDVQTEVSKIWDLITSENINEYTDIDGFVKEFFNLFGFSFEGIDYTEDIEI